MNFNKSKLIKRVYLHNPLVETDITDLTDESKQMINNNILLTIGQHPLYPKDSVREETIIDLLKNNKIFAIGEIGLDKRFADFEWQKKVFLNFLEIAHDFNKPVIIHCVRYYYELLVIIKNNFPDLLYIMHSFQGSIDVINAFKKLNVIYSINKNILKVKNSQKILNEIFEKHNYGFETDIDNEGSHDVLKTMQEIAVFSNTNLEKLIENQYNLLHNQFNNSLI
ncbi:MAG: TatD family hydrolase [Candidatus Cloacimonetes bacterium]|nr:TatD family hydrolase [Candidatus Cloacimonadota bacterium]